MIALLGAGLLLSCGASLSTEPARATLPSLAPVAEGELEVGPSTHERPSLRLRFPYANPSAMLGYGGVQVWARPEQDEIRVGAIIDAPAKEARWARCREATLSIDGEAIRIDAVYMGRPMDGGIYDAVRVELGIHQVRRMARARHLGGSVCGDPFEVSRAQRRMLRRFVDFFDRIAQPRQHGDAPAFREVGPEIELLPNEDEDPGPYPV